MWYEGCLFVSANAVDGLEWGEEEACSRGMLQGDRNIGNSSSKRAACTNFTRSGIPSVVRFRHASASDGNISRSSLVSLVRASG